MLYYGIAVLHVFYVLVLLPMT